MAIVDFMQREYDDTVLYFQGSYQAWFWTPKYISQSAGRPKFSSLIGTSICQSFTVHIYLCPSHVWLEIMIDILFWHQIYGTSCTILWIAIDRAHPESN